jgi:hypothetical protein
MEYKKWLELILKKNNGRFISPEAIGYCSDPIVDDKKYKKNKKIKYKYF